MWVESCDRFQNDGSIEMYFELCCSRTVREKEDKQTESKKRTRCKSIQPTLASTHSLLLLCNTSSYLLTSKHMSRWDTLALKLTANVKCCRLFVFCPVLSALDLLCGKRGGELIEGSRTQRGETGREGVSMKDLLLGGLSWCNTSTSRHHGNPASAPTDCREKESVSVLVCYSTVL